jgi:RND superfamily putative drug exporter
MLRFLSSLFHHVVIRRPATVVGVWLVLAAAVGLAAPSLTRLAAEGQANLLPKDAESVRFDAIVARAWPAQSYQSMAVAQFERSGGGRLTAEDARFARRLAELGEIPGHPGEILRVLGPKSAPEVAARLVSHEGAMQLVAFPMADSFVSPATHLAVAWLQTRAAALEPTRPKGLQVSWTGDAVIGRDYMHSVAQSLNRAAVATVLLLLAVLLMVYRSLLVALVPLVTISVSLIVARGLLAWLTTAGWQVSPLVELFLVVLLFGSGTDFCLFVAWRFAEHWNESADPAPAMEATLHSARRALLTSAGTVIAGLSLMATTRFKLFSSTGPSVAIGLALTLVAAVTLTPGLLVLLARHRPHAFAGLIRHGHAPSGSFWDRLARAVLKRPLGIWLATLAVMVPPALLGINTLYIQDTLSEMPPATASVVALQRVADRFGSGFLAPLTIVIESHDRDGDLKQSEGLAMIDDSSRFLSQNRRLAEVRSATQPLGSTAVLDPARISARLSAVDAGFDRMADGGTRLHDGLLQGIAKIRLAGALQSMIKGTFKSRASEARPDTEASPATSHPLVANVHGTAERLDQVRQGVDRVAEHSAATAVQPTPTTAEAEQRQALINELSRAAEGAGQIAQGARRAGEEIAEILDDPVGRHALDRLLISPRTVREHPELLQSFAAYISADGRLARIDAVQKERVNSEAAMDQVVDLRRRLGEYLAESRWLKVSAGFTGANASAADIRALTRADQHRTWLIVPAGVFMVLLLALRDPWACMNLVATMILTYAFALGITHAVFVNLLGDAGLDWKVPYFLFVLLVAVGVDYNVFLMARLHEEARAHGLYEGIRRAVATTGGLISSAAAITACSFASLVLSPLASLRQLGFALVVGVTVDAVLVRPVLVPCGHWLMKRRIERWPSSALAPASDAAEA